MIFKESAHLIFLFIFIITESERIAMAGVSEQGVLKGKTVCIAV